MTDERKQTALELLKEGLDDGSYAGIMDGINIDVNQPFYQAIAKFAEDYAALKVAEVTKWTYVRDETPPENTQLLAMSPYGVVHITNWRPAYEIFNCQCKSENSQDWQWKLY